MITLVQYTRPSTAPASSYFDQWIDHESWPTWDTDTAWAHVDGPVRQGARGTLKPVKGPRVSFTIHELIPGTRYTDQSTMPGATLTFRHDAITTPTGCSVTAHAWVDGPFARIWAKTAFRDFAHAVPQSMDRLITLVEESRTHP